MSELSINRFASLAETQESPVKQILKVVGGKASFKSPEALLVDLVEAKRESEDRSSEIEHLQNEFEAITESISAINQEARIQTWETQAGQQLEIVSQWLKPLEHSIREIEKALLDAESVRVMSREWWESPAQDTTPWLTFGGRTLAEWRTRWHDIIVELTQSK